MSTRTTRINQLLQQEFSTELHTRWRSEAVGITITGVEISPDLRQAKIFYSVIGAIPERAAAATLLRKAKNTLKSEVFKRVQIKYTPDLHFAYDDSPARGVALIDALDRVAAEDIAREKKHAK